MKKDIVLYLVVPCYNEEDVLDITSKALSNKMQSLIISKKISKESKVLFVDDGSKDRTWNLICKIHESNDLFVGLKLAHNKGNQIAQYAGFMSAKQFADVAISIEADLQDDINVIDKMLDEFKKGSEIVYGVRSSRKKDSIFKKVTASLYYKFMNLIGIEMIPNHSECRLLSKKVLEALSKYQENSIFLRCIIPQINYKSSIVYYDRGERAAGKTKFNIRKMINFAMEGILAFSILPLKLIFSLGSLISVISFIALIVSLILKLLGNELSIWIFVIISIWFTAGLQLVALGIVSEYIGKINTEVKHRPRYFIEEELFN